jgi:hypothetical protein
VRNDLERDPVRQPRFHADALSPIEGFNRVFRQVRNATSKGATKQATTWERPAAMIAAGAATGASTIALSPGVKRGTPRSTQVRRRAPVCVRVRDNYIDLATGERFGCFYPALEFGVIANQQYS